jgi:oligopeptide/dipeptide ABC transporter ATP-binding protein
MSAPLVEGKGVTRHFVKGLDLATRVANLFGSGAKEEVVHAVEDVDIAIRSGEVVGLVGESGCGKSTLGRMLAGLMPLSAGEVRWEGQPIDAGNDRSMKRRRLFTQMIFQDPMSSLNPRKKVVNIIGDAPVLHGIVKRREAGDYVRSLMARVGLDPSYASRYPHQFSGGQRQRIGIARALAVNPRFIICDESVAALDVSIQAQILNQFLELKREFGLTYLFISHDIGVVKHISDRVVIMYLGRVVESAPSAEFFARPNHPYTVALLREVPSVRERRRAFKPISGEIPSPLHPPSGCAFHPRCPHAFDRCRVERPALKPVSAGHLSACHLNDQPTATTRTAPSMTVA